MSPKRTPQRSRKATVSFAACVRGITECKLGQERNTYPYIRDLFIHFLGFKAEDIFTDIANEEGDIPDLAVLLRPARPGCAHRRAKHTSTREHERR